VHTVPIPFSMVFDRGLRCFFLLLSLRQSRVILAGLSESFMEVLDMPSRLFALILNLIFPSRRFSY